MKKTFYIIISTILAVVIVIDVILFLSGSLESFPTAEQIEKGRITYGLIFVLLSTLEAFILSRALKKV